MKLKTYQKLELTGLIIVLLATTIQLTFLTITKDISNGVMFLRIESKIDTIFNEMVNPSPRDKPNYRAGYFNDQDNAGDRVDKQKKWFTYIYPIVMILGSFFLLLGKYLQIKNQTHK